MTDLELFEQWREREGVGDHTCDNCGTNGATLVREGYTTPLPDVAPTYREWQELYLCGECQVEGGY